ncbi:hypothetical protein D3C85_508030 [compost metagenome]
MGSYAALGSSLVIARSMAGAMTWCVRPTLLLAPLVSVVDVVTVAVLVWSKGKPLVAPPNGKRARTC